MIVVQRLLFIVVGTAFVLLEHQQQQVFGANVSSTTTTCDMCMFTSTDSIDCKVYGQLGDRILIPWYKASQECLDGYDIKDVAIEPTQLLSIFPLPDGSNSNVNSFVNYLKLDSGSISNGIKLSFPQFYSESTTTSTGIAVLQDEITVNGVTTNCKTSSSDCYTVMKQYFNTTIGQNEMKDIGISLYNQMAVSKEKEQSIIRIRICSEQVDGTTTISSDCDPLTTQISTIKSKNTTKDCSAFGLGPADTSIPGCSNASTNSTMTGSSPTGASTNSTNTNTTTTTTTTTGGTTGSSRDPPPTTTTAKSLSIYVSVNSYLTTIVSSILAAVIATTTF